MNLNFPNCPDCDRLMDDIYVEEDGEKIGRGSISKFGSIGYGNDTTFKQVHSWYCQFCHAILVTDVEKIDEDQTTLDQWSEEE